MDTPLRTFVPAHEEEISEEQYRELKEAISLLRVAGSIEEQFDLLVGNYFDYEHLRLEEALHVMLYPTIDGRRLQRGRRELERRVLNYLAAFRMYDDQRSRALKELDGDVASDLEAARKSAYDCSLEYRAATQLRNIAQHKAFIVDAASTPMTWEGDPSSGQLVFRFDAMVDLDRLAADSKFKQSVLAEMRSADLVCLTRILRGSLASAGAIHEASRKASAKRVVSGWNSLAATMEEARSLGHKVFGIGAKKLSAGGGVVESLGVAADTKERLNELIRRNGSLDRLMDRVVSNACRPATKSAGR